MKSIRSTTNQALRAIKSELLLAKTKTAKDVVLYKVEEINLLQKLVKQRKESAVIFKDQNREDLAAPELVQAEIIAQFLPDQLSYEAIENIIDDIISKTRAKGMKDMGKVMSIASKEIFGKADGKTISIIVKQKLNG